MSSKHMPWFRAYTEMVDDEKLRLLAFEDRWHFVALLCLKGQGVLDTNDSLMLRKVSVKLGLDLRTLEEVARRLAEVGLIDRETLQPLAWDSRQMKSDTSAERTRAYRERMKRHGDVTVTAQEEDTDTEKEEEKEEEQNTTPSQAQVVKPRKPSIAAPAGVSDAVWADYLQHRKALRAPVNETVVKQLTSQLVAAAELGWMPDDALAEAMAAGWRGLKAAWLQKRSAGPAAVNSRQQAAHPTVFEQGQAAAARAKARLFGDNHAAE